MRAAVSKKKKKKRKAQQKQHLRLHVWAFTDILIGLQINWGQNSKHISLHSSARHNWTKTTARAAATASLFTCLLLLHTHLWWCWDKGSPSWPALQALTLQNKYKKAHVDSNHLYTPLQPTKRTGEDNCDVITHVYLVINIHNTWQHISYLRYFCPNQEFILCQLLIYH